MPTPLAERREFFRSLSPRARCTLLVGIFITFAAINMLPVGMGLYPLRPWWVTPLMAFYGGAVACGWAMSFMWTPRLLWLVAPLSFLFPPALFISLGASGVAMTRQPLDAVVFTSVLASILGVISGYICFVVIVRGEAAQKIRMRAELDLAQRIHESLVPPIDLLLPGAEVHARSIASSEMGGDLIDAVHRAGRLDLVLADVSGHGVRAGVVMGMLKAALRSRLQDDHRPGGDDELGLILRALNSVLSGVVTPGMFATLAAVRIENADEPAGPRVVRCAIAGHPPILRVDARGAVHELPNDHLPLALDHHETYVSAAVECHAGDLLVLYTDGITEAQGAGGEQFGHRRIGEIAGARRSEPLPVVADAIVSAVRAFAQEQTDDQSLLLVRIR